MATEYKWWNPRTWNVPMQDFTGEDLFTWDRFTNPGDDPWALAKDIGPIYTKFINDKLKGFNYSTPNLSMPNNMLESLGNIFRKKDPPYDDYNYPHMNLPYPNEGPQFRDTVIEDDTTEIDDRKKDFITNKFLMRNTNDLTNQRDYTLGGQKVSEIGTPAKTPFKFPSIWGGIMSKFQRSPEKQAEIDAFNKTGMFGSLQGDMWTDQSGLGKVSLRDPETGAVLVRDKNVDSMFGSDTIEEMVAKKDAWIRNRILKNKPISKVLQQYATNQGFYNPGNVTVGNVTSAGDGQVTSRPSWGGHGSVQAYDRSQQAAHDRAVERHRGSAPQRGNWGAAPGTPGAWSPGARDGGRIGYAFAGPVGVEQQTDFIEGPQGGEEFQETVVEGQQQPSREQLEALAMHIFQLPLDQLDDQQLVVVYQAAMQGEPMEEAVQEEDVQFAANGGRAGYLLGGDIEQQTDFLEGPRDDLMASGTSLDDGRNELSLQLFGKELHLLNEIELDQLEEEVQRLMGKFMGAEGGLASIL